MSDYISRADAIEAVVSWTVEDRPTEEMPTDLVDRINALPSADAEFADMPDIPRYYYEKVVGNMAHEINMLKEQLESAVSREDIIGYIDRVRNSGLGKNKALEHIRKYVERTESADAVQGYTEWLEKIIVEAETFEWLCEEATDEEWCEKNCNYASIQAECLRHLYEVSKGGGK